MIEYGDFVSHSGLQLPWKIDCGALTDEDLAALAHVVRNRLDFSGVVGVPTGGLRFAEALRPHCVVDGGFPWLIVDDVLTTGRSMNAERATFRELTTIGVVIFARGPVPSWIHPIFVVNYWTQTCGHRQPESTSGTVKE